MDLEEGPLYDTTYKGYIHEAFSSDGERKEPWETPARYRDQSRRFVSDDNLAWSNQLGALCGKATYKNKTCIKGPLLKPGVIDYFTLTISSAAAGLTVRRPTPQALSSRGVPVRHTLDDHITGMSSQPEHDAINKGTS